jgi:AbrB family looped-hinge helix DNA binding protein
MAVLKTRVDQNGRIVIPAEVRKRLGVEPGDDVVLDVGLHDVRLSSHGAALAALKHLVQEGIRAPYSVDAFLKGRRRGAAEEDGVWRRRRKRGG